MLRPRLIPCILVRDGEVEKTVKFRPGKYIGDPVNTVRLFSDLQADELLVLDISAKLSTGPDFELIQRIARDARMPVCYGGGISRLDQIIEIIQLGIEKVALGRSASSNLSLIENAAAVVGSQSLVGVVDVKTSGFLNQAFKVYVDNGKNKVADSPVHYIERLQQAGIGEILLQSIDRDGTQQGFDEALLGMVYPTLRSPLTILGGANNLGQIASLSRSFGGVGFAAGSLFCFKGNRNAVLINYPSIEERQKLFQRQDVKIT